MFIVLMSVCFSGNSAMMVVWLASKEGLTSTSSMAIVSNLRSSWHNNQ